MPPHSLCEPVTDGVGGFRWISLRLSGTINGDGSLRVRVTATGENTALAGIMRLVEEAQSSKSQTQILADRAAGWLFYIAITTAILTTIGWVIATGWNLTVLERVVTVLALAAGMEADSEHPIARGIRGKAEDEGVSGVSVQDFEAIKGRGAKATHGGQTVHVGGPRLLEILGIQLSGKAHDFTQAAKDNAQSVVYLIVDDEVAAAFALADVVREESNQGRFCTTP